MPHAESHRPSKNRYCFFGRSAVGTGGVVLAAVWSDRWPDYSLSSHWPRLDRLFRHDDEAIGCLTLSFQRQQKTPARGRRGESQPGRCGPAAMLSIRGPLGAGSSRMHVIHVAKRKNFRPGNLSGFTRSKRTGATRRRRKMDACISHENAALTYPDLVAVTFSHLFFS